MHQLLLRAILFCIIFDVGLAARGIRNLGKEGDKYLEANQLAEETDTVDESFLDLEEQLNEEEEQAMGAEMEDQETDLGRPGGRRSRAQTIWGVPTPGEEEFDENEDVRTYSCEDGPFGGEYKMLPVTDERLDWVKKAFTPEEGAVLGSGFDVKKPRESYDTINVRGVWRVKGADRDRFYETQRTAYEQQLARSREFIEQRNKTDDPEKLTIGNIKRSVNGMKTALQKMEGYPKVPHRDGNHTGTLALFMHGTKPEIVPLIACGGLKKGSKGLFGAGVYLSDRIAKIDQYVGNDCDWNEEAQTCVTYIMDTTVDVDGEVGFPPLTEDTIDRSKEMHYGFVVLAAPMRVAHEVAFRKRGGRGRQDEKQIFENPGRHKWEEYGFSRKEQTFEDPSGKLLWEKYKFAHAFSSKEHKWETSKAQKSQGLGREWRPILDRYDEFYMMDEGLATAEYLVAYQWEQSSTEVDGDGW